MDSYDFNILLTPDYVSWFSSKAFYKLENMPGETVSFRKRRLCCLTAGGGKKEKEASKMLIVRREVIASVYKG